MALPLAGVRIVEMGQLIAIPYAIKLLADMGAQVIRIESCARLEMYRTSSLYQNSDEGQYWNRAANFYEQNRNKLSLTLELNVPGGMDALLELISISDVFVENFTPRVMRNFRLELEDLRRVKPDIIVVSSTGYGYSGPWADYGALGFNTEGASGLAHMTGYAGDRPTIPEIPYTDYTSAEHTVFAIMAALVYRARTGKGQFVDVSQTETASSTIPEALMDYTANGRTRPRMGNQDTVMAPHGCYPCRGDDRWIAIAVSTDAQWKALGEVLRTPQWSQDPRYVDALSRWNHREEIDGLLKETTSEWDQHDLMTALQGNGVPAGAVLNGKQLLFDPHLKHRGFYETVAHHPSTGMPPLPYASRPWKMSETPGGIRHAAPLLGQHNHQVLSEVLGKGEKEIAAFERDGVIGDAPLGHQSPPITSLEVQMQQGRIIELDNEYRRKLNAEYGSGAI